MLCEKDNDTKTICKVAVQNTVITHIHCLTREVSDMLPGNE